jgi:hypothetical protein
MATYRFDFYFLDTTDHIAGVETADCADDIEAAKVAIKLIAEHEKQLVVEVWQGERRVSRHSPHSISSDYK